MVKRIQVLARRIPRSIAAALCFAAMSGGSTVAQGDSFTQQRDAEATKNESTGFSIAFGDDRRAFHPGETIALVFTFHRYDISPFNYERTPGLGIADAVLDHSDGTSDPLPGYWAHGGVFGLLSGVRGGIVGGDGKVDNPPIEFPVYLNQAVRFDRPGTYRLYVRSRHKLPEGTGPLPPLISNILEFTIVERDPAWEARTFEEKIGIVNSSTDAAARTNAARSISYLGTPQAVDEIARRLDSVPPWDDPSDPDDDLRFHWLRGLYGARDRAQVIARMEREIDRADRYITSGFASQLAQLKLTHQSTTRPIDLSIWVSTSRAYEARHLAALKAAGGLRKDLERSFAYAAGHNQDIDRYALASAFVDFPDDVEAAFATLSPVQQRTFLITDRNWIDLRHPAFVPMLRRLAGSPNREGPQDIALRLLSDLAPLEGRRIALRELAKRDSVMSVSGLVILPDARLPSLDPAFIRSLEHATTADEYGQAIDRIERFATGRIFARVRRVYERFPGTRTCTLAPAALAYFFRVASAYARAELDKVNKEVAQGELCDDGVLPAIAERRVVPALENSAIAHLNDAQGWVVADAVDMLGQYGSARAEAALWDAFERWHERWKAQKASLERYRPDGKPWEETVETDMAIGLMRGTAWLMTESSARRLASLCLTRDCKESVEREFEDRAPTPTISVSPSDLPLGEPEFAAHGDTSVRPPSRKALRRWLSLHAKGTTFSWEDGGWTDTDGVRRPNEATGLFEDMRLFVESRHMKLVRRSRPY